MGGKPQTPPRPSPAVSTLTANKRHPPHRACLLLRIHRMLRILEKLILQFQAHTIRLDRSRSPRPILTVQLFGHPVPALIRKAIRKARAPGVGYIS
jgi:hypothetical protein